MIDKLTQEQQWGWAFWLQDHNDSIDRQNAAIEEANSLVEDGGPIQPLLPKLTMEEYLAYRLAGIGNDGFAAINRIKWSKAQELFASLSPQQQEALIAQFNIPPVIRD